MDIGNKIKRLRIRNSLTQEELADRCELSKGFISQVERNLASPSIATLEDLLQCLGTDLKTVYGRVTKKFAKSVNVDVNGSVTNYSTVDATVYLYDSTRGEGKVSVVAPEDIEVYEEGNEARIFIKIYRDTVQEIVIVK